MPPCTCDLGYDLCPLCQSVEAADAKNVEADLEWLAGRAVVVGAVDWEGIDF